MNSHFPLDTNLCLCHNVIKEADSPTGRILCNSQSFRFLILLSFVGERAMILSHKIRIYPNREQEQFLKKSCGVARFAYNWGLAEWKNRYKNGEKPNRFKLDKLFNSIKKKEFPFVCEVSKCCSQIAFTNLGRAYKKFFDRCAKYPKFKKKGIHDSFGLANNCFSISNKHVKLSKMSPMRMAEELRFDGKIMYGTVSRVADKWYISIAVEIKKDMTLPKTCKFAGVDLGVKDLVITSDGFKFENPKWITKSEKKLKRLNREMARRNRSSKRRERTRLSLARLHDRVANQRKDWLHKITTYLVRRYDVVSLEDLNVRGMVKNHNLAKAITNVSFGEFNRQIEYKARLYGKKVHRVDRFFPSSKTCSICGCIQEKMPLHIREWTCPDCGAHHDRDVNAATNLLRQAMSEVTHGERTALVISEISDVTKLDSLNRESYKGI